MRDLGRRNFSTIAGSVGLAIALALAGSAVGAKRQTHDPIFSSGPDRTAPTAPGRPTVVSTTTTSITVTWRKSTDRNGLAGYALFRDGVRVSSVSPSTTRFTFSALQCGRSYELGVAAYDKAGNMSPRATSLAPSAACTDSRAPNMPNGLALVDSTESSLTVTWQAATDDVGVVGYDVLLGGLLVGSTASTLYGLTALDCGTMYTVGVRSFDAAGNRSATATAMVTTQACPDRSAPSTPTALAVSSVNETSVTVRWNPATDDRGVAGYGVYRGTATAGTTQATSYTVAGLSCGGRYTIAVDAFDAAGNRSAPASIDASTSACPPQPAPPAPPADTTAPTVPGALTPTGATATTISIRWTASTDNVGVVGYGLYREGTASGSSTVTNATFSGLACGRSYVLAVDAYDASANRSAKASVVSSTAPCPDTTPPSAPSALTQTSATETTIGLNWAASTDNVGVAGYGVYLAGVRVASTGTPGYTLGSLTCGTTYTVAVDAYDAAGSRSSQTTLIVATNACPSDTIPPSTPQNQAISNITPTSFTMSWSAAVDNIGVTTYALYLNGTRVALTTSTSYTYTGLTCATTYTVGLEALDAAGNASDVRYASGSVTTAACAPTSPPPTDTQAPTAPGSPTAGAVTQSSVTVSWAPSTDNVAVTAYGYYRGTTFVGNGTGTSYVFSGLACGTGYTFAIDAADAAGNRSAKSTVSATTSACSSSPSPPPPSGSTANLWVDASGGSCVRQATPGAYTDAQACSWNGAYQAAQTGDVIVVRGGSYGDVRIGPNKTSSTNVTFKTASGESVVVDDLENGHIAGGTGASNVAFIGPAKARTFRSDKANNVVVEGWNVDCNGCDGEQIFHLEAANNVVVRNSEIQDNNNNSLIWISGSNLAFENNVIHDAGLPAGSGAHTECMYAWSVTNLTLRGNHFYHCSVMDVFITGDDVADGGLVENNIFEKPWENTGRVSNSAFAFHFRNGGSPSPDPSNWDFRYNTFVGPLSITTNENPVGAGGMRVIGNVFLAGAPCGHANTTYAYNAFVSGGCGSNNIVNSVATYLAGFVATGDPGNYALTSSSVLRDKGSPTVYPGVDRAGNARPWGSAPDIGAYEYR